MSLLINNAGLMSPGCFDEMPITKLIDMLDVNVTHNVMMTKKFLKKMTDRNQRSGIINVSSTMGFSPFAGQAVYAATKVFVNFFTEAVAYELKDKIDVLCYTPSAIDTNLNHSNSNSEIIKSGALSPSICV